MVTIHIAIAIVALILALALGIVLGLILSSVLRRKPFRSFRKESEERNRYERYKEERILKHWLERDSNESRREFNNREVESPLSGDISTEPPDPK
jgi:MFS superfamily sulfate permease-like transporter